MELNLSTMELNLASRLIFPAVCKLPVLCVAGGRGVWSACPVLPPSISPGWRPSTPPLKQRIELMKETFIIDK